MKKIIFLITVAVVLFVMLLLFFIISNLRQTPEEIVVETPTPTESQVRITPTPAPLVEDEPLVEQIINRLPVSTEKYDIEYLGSTNTYVITIKESPFDQNSAEALAWFTQNGFSNTNTLNIIYNRYEWVE